MIDYELKYIHVEIPETGGKADNCCFPENQQQKDWQFYFGLLSHELLHYSVISCVRNTWERFLSIYLRQKNHSLFPQMSFTDFVEDIYCSIKFQTKPWHTCNVKSQLDFLSDKFGKFKCDHVFHFGNLTRDIEKFTKQYKADLSKIFFDKEKIEHLDYHNFYKPHTKKMIYNLYEKEIDFFLFDFDDPKKFKYPC